MAPDTRPDILDRNGIFGVSRNILASKWNILFDKDAKEWIAFKPALGLHVYPCYSCRHMFHSKKSFQDHVNRRAIMLKYKCPGCSNDILAFYNRCSFLLHCRKHYTLEQGAVNLNNLETQSLPIGLAGFAKVPDIPYLFDVEEEYINDNVFMNAQFYAPKIEDKGKDIVTLTPSHLIINRTDTNGEIQALTLKQIAKNIPKCQFISLQSLRELRTHMSSSDEGTEIKTEPDEPSENSNSEEQSQDQQEEVNNNPPVDSPQDLILPVITKIETVEENGSPDRPDPPEPLPIKCPECKTSQIEPLSSHFLGANRPINENFRCPSCRLICPTTCSFKAHIRVHEKTPPHVCPDCGEEFEYIKDLRDHMDQICYHSSKSVRFRCPGRRCGKIFASEATFGPHFKQTHINTIYRCWTCKRHFNQLVEAEAHSLDHETEPNIVKLYDCTVCTSEDLMNPTEYKAHINFHCKDLNRCMYIYMCKYCKCYFRSIATMSTHLLKCLIQKNGIPKRSRPSISPFMTSKYLSGECKLCNNRIIFLKTKPTLYCNKCVMKPVDSKRFNVADKCVCILCKKQISYDDRRQHQRECKYAKPQVLVEPLDLENVNKPLNKVIQSPFSSSSSDLDSSSNLSIRKHRSDSSEENRPRKRNRPSKPKKPEVENDLTAEEPIPFDGTYQCRLCIFKDMDRQKFHDHIKTHRHISTAYQCMECGECFVVKPSLIKHLLHYHNIYSSEQYFKENECFDEGAIKQLAKVVKAPYMANSVKENQCKVCLEQFSSKDEHDKHFRIHGMAFLMKNSI